MRYFRLKDRSKSENKGCAEWYREHEDGTLEYMHLIHANTNNMWVSSGRTMVDVLKSGRYEEITVEDFEDLLSKYLLAKKLIK